MTTIFVYEHICATEAGNDSPSSPASSLLVEGRAMRDAIATDFAKIPGCQVFTVSSPAEFAITCRQADYTLIIAPEFENILYDFATIAIATDTVLLGSSPEAIQLTSDKLSLYQHWLKHGVNTPRTWEYHADQQSPISTVIKPRDGAGSQATRLNSIPETAAWPGPLIEQEFVSGVTASVAFLIGSRQIIPLKPCLQRISSDGRFTYSGGSAPIATDLRDRAIAIGRKSVECVPGLKGYIGVDVVLGIDHRDWAIEINPRITTSYVGLRQLARFNIAKVMLQLARDEEPDQLEWKAGNVEFDPSGLYRLT